MYEFCRLVGLMLNEGSIDSHHLRLVVAITYLMATTSAALATYCGYYYGIASFGKLHNSRYTRRLKV